MFLPLNDDEPLHVIRYQYVTVGLIVLNVALFLLTGPLAGEMAALAYVSDFGVIPAQLFEPAAVASPFPEPLTLLTYQFLHGGWLHLITNMAFMWVFADNVEDAYGPWSFALFYLMCGAMGGLIHVLMSPTSAAPLIGASGAVSGVIGSYVFLYPRARVWILLFMRIPLRFQAIWVLGGWILLQLASALWLPQAEGQAIAWWAHIGGFTTGLVLTALLRARLLRSA